MFDFLNPPILENERVLLRPLEAADEEHLLPFALNEPEIWTYSLISAAGAEALNAYIRAALLAKAEKKEFPFIVFDKKTQKYAGSTRFYDIQAAHQTTQLGYTWYGKDFQQTGLNRHCKWLMLSFMFDTLGWERVEFRADNQNARSIAAMKKIGCVEEGVLRSHTTKPNGQRRDSIVLSILRSEWNTGGRKQLKQLISE
jgi:N-acetyltransferase